jgi:ABC-type Fe3+-citrate transport system substrate-binding protein
VEECGPCTIFASFTLAFALQRKKNHGKNLSQGKKNLSQVKKNLSQSTVYILQNTHTLQNLHKHTHTQITGKDVDRSGRSFTYSTSTVLQFARGNDKAKEKPHSG